MQIYGNTFCKYENVYDNLIKITDFVKVMTDDILWYKFEFSQIIIKL